MPPLISFSMGSLGFLTPFHVSEHEPRLEQLLDCGCHLTLRSRLYCRIERAGQRDEQKSRDGWLALNEVVIDRGCASSSMAPLLLCSFCSPR